MSVVVVVVAAHSLHPVQHFHEHLNDQLSWLCAQKDSHSLNLGVRVLVVMVIVAVGSRIVVGAGVGTVPGALLREANLPPPRQPPRLPA